MKWRHSIPLYCTTIYRFLAETYASEASCVLGKLDDALQILQSLHTQSQEAPSSSSVLDTKNFPRYFFTDNSYPTRSARGRKGPERDGLFDPQEGLNAHTDTDAVGADEDISFQKLTSSVNFATALTLQGDFSQAQGILESLREGCPTFAPAIKLLSYLLLRRGHHKEALLVIKGSHSGADSVDYGAT